jgi:type IV secretion system protein VirD4
VLCFAPTRSGKGVGLVVPSLLTWPGSAIVHDIKGENWQLTAGFRARHGRVLLFDPTNPRRRPTIRCSRCAAANGKCATSRTSPTSWSIPKARSKSATIGRRPAIRCWSAPSSMSSMPRPGQDARRRRRLPVRSEAPIESTLRRDDDDAASRRGRAASRHRQRARELLNKSDNERSGVLSTAMSFLGLYRDPVVAEVTRRCDWRIADSSEGAPTTLYLVVPPSDINRTKPLIRLILNQIGRRLTEDLHAKAGRHRLLLMLDEFPALGRLDFFESRWPSWRATASRPS